MIKYKIVTFPPISEEITKVHVTKFLKNVGDFIYKGDPFLEIETDTAFMEIPSEYEGRIFKYLIEENSNVRIGENICVLSEFDPINNINLIKKSLSSLEEELVDINVFSNFH